MNCFDKCFCEHPRNVNMTYFEHMCFSCTLASKFYCASVQACIHSIFPYFYQTSSSDYSREICDTIENIHNIDCNNK